METFHLAWTHPLKYPGSGANNDETLLPRIKMPHWRLCECLAGDCHFSACHIANPLIRINFLVHKIIANA